MTSGSSPVFISKGRFKNVSQWLRDDLNDHLFPNSARQQTFVAWFKQRNKVGDLTSRSKADFGSKLKNKRFKKFCPNFMVTQLYIGLIVMPEGRLYQYEPPTVSLTSAFTAIDFRLEYLPLQSYKEKVALAKVFSYFSLTVTAQKTFFDLNHFRNELQH